MIEANPTLRARVYWWLERPDRNADGPLVLEIALIVLITLNVGAVILETVAPIYAHWKSAFDLFESMSLLVFVAEYLARLWVAPENPAVQSRREWVSSPLAIVDLLAILPAVLVLFSLSTCASCGPYGCCDCSNSQGIRRHWVCCWPCSRKRLVLFSPGFSS